MHLLFSTVADKTKLHTELHPYLLQFAGVHDFGHVDIAS